MGHSPYQQRHPNVPQQLSYTAFNVSSEQHVACCLNDGSLEEIAGEELEEDFDEGLVIWGTTCLQTLVRCSHPILMPAL